jgi:hypothetical protein
MDEESTGRRAIPPEITSSGMKNPWRNGILPEITSSKGKNPPEE